MLDAEFIYVLSIGFICGMVIGVSSHETIEELWYGFWYLVERLIRRVK